MLLAAGVWLAGAPIALVGVFVAWQGGLRCHRLARRWLVFVPAGLVVHDLVILAEPYLFRVIDLAAVRLAMADTGAADFTGDALGPAIEITLAEPAKMVLAPTPSQPAGKGLHVGAMLVSPTRPGTALAAAAAARLPG
jgi:hypothetical protein